MPYPIELYFWPTPNGKKITIFLDEAALPYNLAPVDITAGEQFDEEFLKIGPNHKMPAIVDPEGPDGEPISVFESELSWSTLPRRQADSCRTPSMADTKRCSG